MDAASICSIVVLFGSVLASPLKWIQLLQCLRSGSQIVTFFIILDDSLGISRNFFEILSLLFSGFLEILKGFRISNSRWGLSKCILD